MSLRCRNYWQPVRQLFWHMYRKRHVIKELTLEPDGLIWLLPTSCTSFTRLTQFPHLYIVCKSFGIVPETPRISSQKNDHSNYIRMVKFVWLTPWNTTIVAKMILFCFGKIKVKHSDNILTLIPTLIMDDLREWN